MDRNDYYLMLRSKYRSDLNKLIKDFSIDGESMYAKESKNKFIRDSVDNLFRSLSQLQLVNTFSDSYIRNHTLEKTLLILANFYLLDAELLNHENGTES